MRLRCRRGRGLVGGAVAGDQREALRARREAVPARAAPEAVGGDDDAAPARTAKLGGDPLRTKPGMTEREGDKPLLDEQRELVGHLRPTALARTQHLESVPVDLCFPAVVGRAVEAEGPAGGRDSDAAGEIEQLQPVAEEDIILRHATRSFRLATKRA